MTYLSCSGCFFLAVILETFTWLFHGLEIIRLLPQRELESQSQRGVEEKWPEQKERSKYKVPSATNITCFSSVSVQLSKRPGLSDNYLTTSPLQKPKCSVVFNPTLTNFINYINLDYFSSIMIYLMCK